MVGVSLSIRGVTALLLSGAAAALIACGGSDEADSPASTSSAKTTSTATAQATTASSAIRVTDRFGRNVEIPATPKRIVALSPTGVELVYALGGTVVGRSTTATFPASAASATDIGPSYQPNVEAILALNPDLVIGDAFVHSQPQLRTSIEGLRVPVIFAGGQQAKDIDESINLVGTVLGAKERAAALIKEIEDARVAAEAKIKAAGAVNAVVLIADRDQTLYGATKDGYAGVILAQVGITNAVADQPQAAAFPGYSAVPTEVLLRANPAYIFTITPAPAPAPRLSTLIPQIPPLRGLAAVQQNKVIELDTPTFLEAPGPRIAVAYETLANIVTGQPTSAAR